MADQLPNGVPRDAGGHRPLPQPERARCHRSGHRRLRDLSAGSGEHRGPQRDAVRRPPARGRRGPVRGGAVRLPVGRARRHHPPGQRHVPPAHRSPPGRPGGSAHLRRAPHPGGPDLPRDPLRPLAPDAGHGAGDRPRHRAGRWQPATSPRQLGAGAGRDVRRAGRDPDCRVRRHRAARVRARAAASQGTGRGVRGQGPFAGPDRPAGAHPPDPARDPRPRHRRRLPPRRCRRRGGR